MSSRDVAIEYLNRFCGGDIDAIEATLDADFSLSGPLFQFESRAAYIACLREDPPELAEIEILDVSEGENTVSIYYLYKKPTGTITVAQLFKFRAGRIAETLLVFDSAGVI